MVSQIQIESSLETACYPTSLYDHNPRAYRLLRGGGAMQLYIIMPVDDGEMLVVIKNRTGRVAKAGAVFSSCWSSW